MAEFKSYRTQTMDGANAFLTIASGPVIIHDGKVLLIKDDNDPFYKFPGGSELDDESHIDTAVREAKEETGLDIEIVGEPFVFTFHKTNTEGVTKYYVLLHYLAHLVDSDLNLEEVAQENDRLGLFDLDSLPENVAPNVEGVLRHFLKK